jgi:hypothetical protein
LDSNLAAIERSRAKAIRGRGWNDSREAYSVNSHADISLFAESTKSTQSDKDKSLGNVNGDDDSHVFSGKGRNIPSSSGALEPQPVKVYGSRYSSSVDRPTRDTGTRAANAPGNVPKRKIYRPRPVGNRRDGSQRLAHTHSARPDQIATTPSLNEHVPASKPGRATSGSRNLADLAVMDSAEGLETLRWTVADQEQKLVWLMEVQRAQLQTIKDEHRQEIERLWKVIEALTEPKNG